MKGIDGSGNIETGGLSIYAISLLIRFGDIEDPPHDDLSRQGGLRAAGAASYSRYCSANGDVLYKQAVTTQHPEPRLGEPKQTLSRRSSAKDTRVTRLAVGNTGVFSAILQRRITPRIQVKKEPGLFAGAAGYTHAETLGRLDSLPLKREYIRLHIKVKWTS